MTSDITWMFYVTSLLVLTSGWRVQETHAQYDALDGGKYLQPEYDRDEAGSRMPDSEALSLRQLVTLTAQRLAADREALELEQLQDELHAERTGYDRQDGRPKRGRFQGFCFTRSRSGRYIPYICWKGSR